MFLNHVKIKTTSLSRASYFSYLWYSFSLSKRTISMHNTFEASLHIDRSFRLRWLIPTHFPMLISLNMALSNCENMFKASHFLQNVPDLIIQYRHELRKFRCQMRDIENSIELFQSRFWIIEYRWFVRCFIIGHILYLGTFPIIDLSSPHLLFSTDSEDNQESYFPCWRMSFWYTEIKIIFLPQY